MAKQLKKASEGFNEILLYTTPNGKVKVEIYLQNETIWLTQQKIAELFGVDRTVVTKHLANIYSEGELVKGATSAKIAQVQLEGNREVNRQIEFYNLDSIISVGYRVNSSQATAFRIWATERLKEYIIKGFTMDDERLKNPNNIFGKDYFEEQLARIRDYGLALTRLHNHLQICQLNLLTCLQVQADSFVDYKEKNTVNQPINQNFFAALFVNNPN